jgi:hypothetical protein
MDLREVGRDTVDWIFLARNRDKCGFCNETLISLKESVFENLSLLA